MLGTHIEAEQFATDEGGDLQNGLSVNGILELGDIDVYQFETDVGAPVVVNLASTGDNGRTRLQVYDPEGVLLGDNTANGLTSALDFIVATNGAHTIVVRENLDDSQYTYRLQATTPTVALFASDEGGSLISRQTSTGKLDTGDIDVFTYEIANGQQIVIDLIATANNGRTRLQVYNAANQLLGDNTNNGATSQIVYTGVADETLFIVVRENGDNDTYDYDLTLSLN